MKNADAPKSHLLSHEVNVELNMLRATMMNGVGREVDCRDIVTVDNGGLRDIKKQLLEKLSEPRALGDGIGHITILSLGTRAGDRGLSVRRPRYERGLQVDANSLKSSGACPGRQPNRRHCRRPGQSRARPST